MRALGKEMKEVRGATASDNANLHIRADLSFNAPNTVENVLLHLIPRITRFWWPLERCPEPLSTLKID